MFQPAELKEIYDQKRKLGDIDNKAKRENNHQQIINIICIVKYILEKCFNGKVTLVQQPMHIQVVFSCPYQIHLYVRKWDLMSL